MKPLHTTHKQARTRLICSEGACNPVLVRVHWASDLGLIEAAAPFDWLRILWRLSQQAPDRVVFASSSQKKQKSLGKRHRNKMSAVTHRNSPHTLSASMSHPPMDSNSNKSAAVQSEGESPFCLPASPLPVENPLGCLPRRSLCPRHPKTMFINLNIDIIVPNLISIMLNPEFL